MSVDGRWSNKQQGRRHDTLALAPLGAQRVEARSKRFHLAKQGLRGS